MTKQSMKWVLSVLAVCALTGCDAAKDLAALVMSDYPLTNTVTVMPGYKMRVGDHDVPVFGFDFCPSRNNPDSWIIAGAYPSEADSRSCIVIAPDTTSVKVRFVLHHGLDTENWTVERSADGIMLRRADGAFIAAAH